MALNVGKVVSELRGMSVGELRQKYADAFGEQTRSHHKDYLIRRIAWRMQANDEGGLPERARRRALEIADDADLRTRAPGPPMRLVNVRRQTYPRWPMRAHHSLHGCVSQAVRCRRALVALWLIVVVACQAGRFATLIGAPPPTNAHAHVVKSETSVGLPPGRPTLFEQGAGGGNPPVANRGADDGPAHAQAAGSLVLPFGVCAADPAPHRPTLASARLGALAPRPPPLSHA